MVGETLAELMDWAFEKSRVFHQLAHENEGLRKEYIASSAAYRELALELRARAEAETPNLSPQGHSHDWHTATR